MASSSLSSSSRAAVLRTMRQGDSQMLRLPDGRVLGFAEYGDPQGRPVFFLHGFPSSRLEGSGADKIGRRRRLRIISPDRPGFGLSTFDPTRRMTDWPADVRALADHLDLPRFAVIGGSGGGPFALACAHALPATRLTAVGILAGAGPWDQGTRVIPLRSRLTAVMVEYTPSLFRVLLSAVVGTARWVASTAWATRRIDAWLESVVENAAARNAAEPPTTRADVPKSEREDPPELTIPERRAHMLRTLFEGFSQGSEPTRHEARLLSQDWGFRLEEVAYDPVKFWHGTKDTNAPIDWIRPMVQRVRHGVLKEFDDNHYTIGYHLDTILQDLLPDDEHDSKKTA